MHYIELENNVRKVCVESIQHVTSRKREPIRTSCVDRIQWIHGETNAPIHHAKYDEEDIEDSEGKNNLSMDLEPLLHCSVQCGEP